MQGNFDNVWLVILEKLRSIFDQLCLVRPEIQILSWLMYSAVYESSPELFTQVNGFTGVWSNTGFCISPYRIVHTGSPLLMLFFQTLEKPTV